MARKPIAAEPGATATYFALTPINHNGEEVKVGDPVELTETEAAPLLGCKPPAIRAEGETAEADAGQ